MKSLHSNLRAQKRLEYLFNRETIRILRRMEQTDEVVSKIIQLSIEYGILTPYTGLVGKQEFISEQEKARIMSSKEKYKKERIRVFVKTLTGKHIEVFIHSKESFLDLKDLICVKEWISPDQQRLIFKGWKIENEQTIDECCIVNDTTIHLILRLRGGAYSPLKIEYVKYMILLLLKKF